MLGCYATVARIVQLSEVFVVQFSALCCMLHHVWALHG
jgi:hypothetical protein